MAVTYLLLRRRLGLALTAIRDSEQSAQSLGVPVFRTKFAVYLVAAFGCSLAGAVIYLNLLRVLASDDGPGAAELRREVLAGLHPLLAIGAKALSPLTVKPWKRLPPATATGTELGSVVPFPRAP